MFEWSNFLDLAGHLIEEGDAMPSPEAKARTSISRSYYCAYHLAREFLQVEGDTKIGGNMPDSHVYVIKQFIGRHDDLLRKIGNQLYSLRGARNQADYEDDISINLLNAKIAWKKASHIKGLLEKEIKRLRK